MLSEQLHNLARAIRRALEEEERKRVPRLTNITLRGKCAIASFRLQQAMQSAGLHGEFVLGTFAGHDHCWVSHAGKIIDITATQFCIMDAVYITEYDARFIPRKLNEPALKEIAEFWPPSQRPVK